MLSAQTYFEWMEAHLCTLEYGTKVLCLPVLTFQINPINPGFFALELTLGRGVFHLPAIKQEPLKQEG